MRRHEGGLRQQLAPLRAQFDQVLPIGAVAVQEHDQLLHRAALGIEPRSVDRGRHVPVSVGFQDVSGRLARSRPRPSSISTCRARCDFLGGPRYKSSSGGLDESKAECSGEAFQGEAASMTSSAKSAIHTAETVAGRSAKRADLKPVFRFAPSPNGYLHIGHAYSALRNYEMARQHDGRFLLRLEDIDVDRCRPEYEQAIFDDLAWLGLQWEEPVLRQSEHFSLYASAVERLRDRGLLYPCFCSRLEISRVVSGVRDWPRDPDGGPIYPGTCRHLPIEERERRLASGQHAALRIDMAKRCRRPACCSAWCEFGEGEEGRDVRAEPSSGATRCWPRKDIPTSYHV